MKVALYGRPIKYPNFQLFYERFVAWKSCKPLLPNVASKVSVISSCELGNVGLDMTTCASDVWHTKIKKRSVIIDHFIDTKLHIFRLFQFVWYEISIFYGINFIGNG